MPLLAHHLQLYTRLRNGQRLEVPPCDKLPGADTRTFAGLQGYIALMQWVAMHIKLCRCTMALHMAHHTGCCWGISVDAAGD